MLYILSCVVIFIILLAPFFITRTIISHIRNFRYKDKLANANLIPLLGGFTVYNIQHFIFRKCSHSIVTQLFVCYFRLSEFLTDCAERIIVLKIVYGRIMNRLVADFLCAL